jgi:hypothetical protein
MGRVATGTALSLQRQVLKHEGALLVRVAPDTDGIAGRDLAYTPQSVSAVKVMTIRALATGEAATEAPLVSLREKEGKAMINKNSRVRAVPPWRIDSLPFFMFGTPRAPCGQWPCVALNHGHNSL